MNSKGYIVAAALAVLSITTPVRADIIMDQSRLSFSSPQAPNLDKIFWMSGNKGGLSY